MKKILILIALVAFAGCKHLEEKPEVAPPVKIENPPVILPPNESGSLGKLNLKNPEIFMPRVIQLQKGRSISLPGKGLLVHESHYQTKLDARPTSLTSGMAAHMTRSCELLRKAYPSLTPGCPEVYTNKYAKQWTPAEGGGIGQNARGTQIDPWREMWQGNMYFTAASRPKSGEKWLIWNTKNGRCLVASFGDEVGPSSAKYIGGVVTEVQWYLKATSETVLNVGILKNQDLPYGPADCEM